MLHTSILYLYIGRCILVSLQFVENMKDWTVTSSQLLLLGFLKYLYPCNYLNVATSSCSVLHHTIRTDSFVSHYPWALSPSKYDIGIKHNLTLSWQKLWGLRVIWEVTQFSLAVRYRSSAKPVASGHTLEMTTVGSSKTLEANHQTIYQHVPECSNPFEIMFFRTSENYIFIDFFGYRNYYSHVSILKQPCCEPLQELIYPVPHSKFLIADI